MIVTRNHQCEINLIQQPMTSMGSLLRLKELFSADPGIGIATVAVKP